MGVRVWDVPTRVLHWGLAVSAVTAFGSGGEPTWGGLHVVAGVAATAFVASRLGWGFAGERWSRFRTWTTGPAHTRSAAVSAATALAGVGVLGLTGVVVQAGEEARGPLAGWVSPAVGVAVHPLHTAVAWAGVGWLAVHLAGIARQSWKERQNLTAGMLHGRKSWEGPPVRARLGSAALGALAGLVVVPSLSAVLDRPAPVVVVRSDPWEQACGECHAAYPPGTLPADSWAAMLDPDADHFGDVLGLDPATLGAVSTFAATRSADLGETAFAVGVRAEGGAPLRITGTATWRAAHEGLPDATFDAPEVGSRGRCTACHGDALEVFDARSATVPEPEPVRPGAPGRRS
jgi:cytochrome b